MATEKNKLIERGILYPDGQINKTKINLISGAITKPFAEMIWCATGNDKETINRFTDILVEMNNDADRKKLFKIIQMCYGLMGINFPEEATYMNSTKTVLEYFIFSFTADFGEIMQEYISETK